MMKNSIVWSSGLNIWDESYLSTLCVFYDEVLLPATTDVDELCRFTKPLDTEENYKINDIVVRLYLTEEEEKFSAGEYHQIWENKNKVLFEEEVIKRLKPQVQYDYSMLFDDGMYEELTDILMDIPKSLRSKGPSENNLFLWKDHIFHLLRNDILQPTLFVTKQQHTHREVIKSLIALKAFNYLLPQLCKLHPEQILEVRNEVSANREGFSLHLQTLSYEVETRIQEGDSIEEIQRYANSVADALLIPDYLEFKRQISAKRAGFWGDVLDKASKVAEIDAAPLSPKFCLDLMKIFGFTTLKGIAATKDELSNKTQSFNLIRTIENKT